MSTLTGNKISLTYKSLIKTADNDVLSGALKQLSDGLGNNSGVYLNTGGDLKSTGTLEFANFKGTSTAVTINKLVNEADGISNNDNDTSLPTSAAVKDYVDTHVTSQDLDFSDGTNQSAVDLDSQVLAVVGTTNEIDTVASGQQLKIGLPNSITISGTYTGATFLGDLNGTINTATTAVTQSAGNNSTKVATTAYVDTLDAASDLDFSGTTGTGDVNLNTQSLAVTGTANQITTAASNQGLEISLLSTGVTMPDGSVATTQTAGDNSTKLATTAYVDTLDAASDLDIAGDSGTGDVNLNTQSFTLSGTTNQVITGVSGQTATFSLPSTVHRNLQGNVTGDLTGNADTATKWETARDLSLTSEATGTISSVDGTNNVSGAVTLLNSAVTAKVLTGLPTPAAGNIEPSDTILEAFGKVQSQINSISSGLVFKGSWDAATNTPNLISGGGEVDSGTTDGATTAFKLIDSSQNFNTTVSVGNKVINQVDGQTALVTVIDSNTQLTLDADIMLTAEAYTIDASPFISQGQYYVVNYAGTTNLNGITDWSIGDWVIADANNEWSKLDHSQIDGQGTTGNLPVFTTANTIGDSIVSESGTALTITGSLNTTLGASVTGDFSVNTDKFTVAAVSGETNIKADVSAFGEIKSYYNGANYSRLLSGVDGGSVSGFNSSGGSFIIRDHSYSQIVSDGNFGIGIGGSTAIQKVHIQGTGTTYMHIANDTTGSLTTDGADIGFFTGQTSLQIINRENDSVIISTNDLPRLTIDGSGNSTFAGDITFGDSHFIGDDADDNLLIQSSANENIIIDSLDKLLFRNSGTTNLTINGSGNATFAGDVKIAEATNKGQLFFGTANTDYEIKGGGNYGYLSLNAPILRFDTGGTERMRINSSGNVGIGETIPLGKLHVKTTDTASTASSVGNLLVLEDNENGMSILSSTAGAGYILFGDSGDNDIGGILYDHSTNSMRFRTNGVWDRMRIDSLGNVGIGASTIGGDLHIERTASSPTLLVKAAGQTGSLTPTATLILAPGSSSGYSTAPKITGYRTANFSTSALRSTGLKFSVSSANAQVDAMWINEAGNVGIGTDSPANNLQVKTGSNGGGITIQRNSSTSGSFADLMFSISTSDVASPETKIRATRGASYDDTDISFITSNSERMRIDSSGNVGIGTVSPDYKLSLRDDSTSAYPLSLENNNIGTAGVHTGIRFGYAGNTYQKGAIIFESQDANGRGKMYFAMEGTANSSNADETDAKMTIDYDGNVGIGTDSPISKFSVEGDDNTNQANIGHSTQAVYIKVNGTNVDYNSSGNSSGSHTFSTGNTERMRITSGGNVAMGNGTQAINNDAILTLRTTAFAGLDIQSSRSAGNNLGGIRVFHTASTTTPVSQFLIEDDGSYNFYNGSNGAENRMRITSGGDLLVGCVALNAQRGFAIEEGAATNVQIMHNFGEASGTTYMQFLYATGVIGSITQNGTTGVSYNTSSDYRLKEDLQDFAGLDMVSKIPVYDFKWKTDESRSYGVMAHELQEVLPQAVSGDKDAEEMQSVDYSKIVPLLVKSIQELTAKVDKLKQECKCK